MANKTCQLSKGSSRLQKKGYEESSIKLSPLDRGEVS
jgi:hypothetical protein